MKKDASFLIDIVDTQNHTWQGRLYWVQEKKSVNFRGELELMQLLSSAVSPAEEEEEHSDKIVPLEHLG